MAEGRYDMCSRSTQHAYPKYQTKGSYYGHVGIICVSRVCSVSRPRIHKQSAVIKAEGSIIYVLRVHSILTSEYTNRLQLMALKVGIICVPRVYSILTPNTQNDGSYLGSDNRYNLCTQGIHILAHRRQLLWL